MLAHEYDITLNQCVNKALTEAMRNREWAEKDSEPG
jgi:hypothetical protein